MHVLVTGATGFVGRAVVARLLAGGHNVVAATRSDTILESNDDVRTHVVGEVNGTTDWSRALVGIDGVVHLVGRTHRRGDTQADRAAYRAVNVHGTRRLAEQARAAGVQRVVFVSSVKAQAERSETPLSEDDAPHPEDVYGETKLEAEDALSEALAGGPAAYTVIRPPLVYGPGVRANLRWLAHATLAGWPLPFGCVNNLRSLIGVDNLADMLARALTHPAAAGRTYLAADGIDLSTRELTCRMAEAGGTRARLVAVPPAWLRAGLKVAGRSQLAERVLGSLRVDCSRARRELAWEPPVSLDAGLAAMVHDLQMRHGR